ncbi:hypothetical protein [Aquimarina sp. 2201CG14-23]|uniref:hypothetical protein n=1 Tax=Aquimarina mycalae TaxID=3040073 RepID=UPI002477E3D7|nr:hypothetical protein [Aquimarina sp. 2201CG14-23]MDH7445633.1 hypothetical protein [Aquimarina sp. 2201CG14-23]
MKRILLFLSVLMLTQNYAQNKEYTVTLQEILAERNRIKTSYTIANSEAKDSILKETRKYLFKTLVDDIFEYWYETPWDFNGHTTIPRKGKIACGYFVTTTLEDLGFAIPRFKWAQSASEVFIKKLAVDQVTRFTNKPVIVIENFLLEHGNGLYLVGLDDHTGFIVVKNKKVRFIHASYYKPEIGVMSEVLDSENPLKYSKYRVIGKLLSDTMVENWINTIRYY